MPRKPEDLTGKTFGNLLVLERAGKYEKNSEWLWRCKCLRCGNETVVRISSLKSNHSKSCGCLMYDNPGRPFKGENEN